MKFNRSWLGIALTLMYTCAAIYIIQDELRNTGGGWINLRGLGTLLITAPSQVTFGIALEWLGVPKVNFDDPGLVGYSQLILHVTASAAVFYLAGYLIERLVRRLARAFRTSGR